VRILAEGSTEALDAFLSDLGANAPPLSRIDHLDAEQTTPAGLTGFRVADSDLQAPGRLPVSPDVAMCDACAEELADPEDRRFRYPFITCTDCGPRFTVIESMPYDRERTTMRAFQQCPACAAEYADPVDRRYHSETNSCPECGPSVWLERDGQECSRGGSAIVDAAHILREGGVVAARGLGGFHVAVDAENEGAVLRLRSRKHRDEKPLAVMVRTLDQARALASVSEGEARLLSSPERPIVVLRRRNDTRLAGAVAPGLSTVGVMLGYTPFHHLLLLEADRPLVMTSGNESEEPIAIGNEEARRRLGTIADALLLHDREIVARYDDSLVRASAVGPVFLRRARGYAPLPVELPVPTPVPFLAVGPHLKNTLTLADEGWAWVSQHVGDLENVETLAHFHDVLHRFRTLFRVEPEAVVRDLHPGYLSTRIAEESGLKELEPVQHHHAHVAAVQAEHGFVDDVLGLAFDGTGYGDDGRVWGAEFLRCSPREYRRLGHLRYAPLPGGDIAARAPWRVAVGYASLQEGGAQALLPSDAAVDPAGLATARQQTRRGVNAPLASSMGRLFDAASAVLGVRMEARHEGQAPMELESLAGDASAEAMPFPVARSPEGMWVLDPVPLLEALASLRDRGVDPPELAARFHESVVCASASLAVRLCDEEGLDAVALGGGCFQNVRLLDGIRSRLENEGLRVLVPCRLGPNDGAVSYGQAVIAAARLND
jgi:hydrogenase maturation protein HypF